MKVITKLPDLGKAFERFKGELRPDSGQDDIPAGLFVKPCNGAENGRGEYCGENEDEVGKSEGCE